MKYTLSVDGGEPLICLADQVVYAQIPYWCGGASKALALSVMRPRQYYPYDPAGGGLPAIVFFCGGAFSKMDRNVQLPELVYYAKRGYAVFSVEYATDRIYTVMDQVLQCKRAIRFIRAHAAAFDIDPARLAVLGDSAGGYLALAAAVSGDDPAYRLGGDLDQSDTVQAAAALFPVTTRAMAANIPAFPDANTCRLELLEPADHLSDKTPPILTLHGTDDHTVAAADSVAFHEALDRAKVPNALYLVEGADHGDALFAQTCVKEIILGFLDDALQKR